MKKALLLIRRYKFTILIGLVALVPTLFISKSEGAAASTNIAADIFNRTVSNGWGSADTGGAWSNTGSAFHTTPGSAIITAGTTPVTNYLGSVSAQDVDYKAKISPAAINATFPSYGLVIRYNPATGASYRFTAWASTGSNSGKYSIHIKRLPVNTTIGSDINTNIPGGTPIWLRTQVFGSNPTTLNIKIWQDGTAEPAAWTATNTDSTSGIQGAGSLGLIASENSGTTNVAFNNLSATSIDPPNAALSLSPATGVKPLAVTADAYGSTQGSFPISTYKYDFGDGTIIGPQAGSSATHTYTTAGTYTVTLTATDTQGLTSIKTATVTVTNPNPPTAGLTVAPNSGNAPLAVTANGSSSTAGTNAISTYKFDFGDGVVVGPQAGATANHTYNSAGTYTVTETVTDSIGLTGTKTSTVTVTTAPVDNPPTASLTVTPSSGTAPVTVTADASASTDTDATPISTYSFDFGDGTIVGPQASSSSVHTYNSAGSYTTTVTVKDAANNSSTATATVNVSNPSAIAPTAALSVSPSSGLTPLATTADASGSNPGSNPISTYTFDFDDGTSVGPQTGSTATHTYSSAGTFTVRVTVTDSSGLTGSTSQTVTATAPTAPSATLSVNPMSGFNPLNVTADATGSSAGSYPISTYTFNYGDGTVVGPQASVTSTHTYTSAGTFTVTLTVTDIHGQSNTKTATVTVTNPTPPTAALSVTPSSGTVPFSVTADASGSSAGTNAISTYTFNFGDGTSVGPQAGSSATHSYTAAGSYTLTVTVTDTAGFTAAKTATVTANAPSSTVASDTFNRTVTNGWGTADLGGAWSGTGSAFSVTSGSAKIVAGTTPVANYLSSISVQNVDYKVRISPPSINSTYPSYGLVARYNSSTGASYRFTTWASTGSNSGKYSIHVKRLPANTTIGSDVNTSIPGGTPVWLRLQTFGANPTTLNWKIWQDGTAEPSTWTGTATDSTSGLQGPGALGLIASQTSGTVTIPFSNLSATSTTSPAGPTAALTVTPATGTAPLNVIADASASTAGSNPLSAYSFNFGDGVTVGPQAEAIATHTYNAAGTYTATLTVTDTAGFSDTTTQTVTANNSGSTPPTASLTTTPTTGSAPLAVAADGSASTAGTNAISTYTFNFGDGVNVGPQAGSSAAHTYINAGNYTLTLTVTDTTGLTATKTATITVQQPNSSGLSVSNQTQSGIGGGFTNNQNETDVTWTNGSGNGWRVGMIPTYGGALISPWYEMTGGTSSINQTSLATSIPDGFLHLVTNRGNFVYQGTETHPYALTELGPTGTSFRRYYSAREPSTGTDSNGFNWTINTAIYPGDPGFLVERIDITNPSSQALAMNGSDGIETALIGGLQQSGQNVWQPGNGGYGFVGGSQTTGWPANLAGADPDYVYITPATGSGINTSVESIQKTHLSSLGATNVAIQFLQNNVRLKIKVQGDLAVFPANTTYTLYYLQALHRNGNSADAASIAADYLNPDAPVMATGSFTGFSYDEGLYQMSTSSNTVQFTHNFSSTVTERWLDIYKISGYTASAQPTVTIGGTQLTNGVDYISYVDTVNQVAYVKLMRPIVAGSATGNQLNSASILIH